ncbi:MAG: hypothetical protein A2086_05755 [Spirochaetes bacterium GWD1_27_9]|nr:MAG: hypothetical protein A2Z98_05980 [Spirochaetes bacterium GWB1_27_13]OHD20268.1 MAG: hypothetical protein A2Y34_15070 [Spirochaetes bacterium GWC1_27_15]OHD35282.1 MAG: hypothetical protein A2086_05755 [Spirochaetes bacterium GWD1_27_9]
MVKLRENVLSYKPILSSKVRIVRNIKDLPFVDNLNFSEKREIEEMVINFAKKFNVKVYEINSLTENQKRFFIEKSIEKKDFFYKKEGKFIYFPDDDVYLLINSKEHLKFVNISYEGNLKSQYEAISKIENLLSTNFKFAANQKFGYLTQEIKNCGLGLKFSFLVHTPGLIFQKKTKETFEDLATKGYYIEKYLSSEESYYYIISSNLNFGVSEENLIDRFIEGVNYILDVENKNLFNYYNNYKDFIDDIIFRSYGILKYSKKITENEALIHISNLLIGFQLNLPLESFPDNINKLISEVREGNIRINAEKENIDSEVLRSNIVKKYLFTGEK